MRKSKSLEGRTPESWRCIDCGINTAPGMPGRREIEQAYAIAKLQGREGVELEINEFSEVYQVKPEVWKAAGMEPMGGCLCIGCLERRLGRRLVPKDFNRKHPLHSVPGTDRLSSRRDGEALG